MRAIAFAAILLVPMSARAERLLIDAARETTFWQAYLGWEFPGATGRMTVVDDPAQGRCLDGRFTFAAESRYAGLQWQGEIAEAEAIGFRVWLADRDQGLLRIGDDLGQEHLGGFQARRDEWVNVEVPIRPEGFPNHWGGPNDGQFHFPLRSVLIGMNRGPDEGEMRISTMYIVKQHTAAAERWRVSIEPRVPSGVAFRGDKAEYAVRVLNRLENRAECELSVSEEEPGGKPAEADRRRIAVDGWAQNDCTIALNTDRVGYRCLRAQLSEPSAGALAQAVSGLVVVPRPRHYGQEAPGCYFGLQFCPDMEAAERLGAKAIREAPGWRWAEPREGMIRWADYLDLGVQPALDHRMQVLLTLQSIAPEWAAWQAEGRPKLRDLPDPAKLDAWRRYVQQVAEHYRGRLAAIEIQNEPDLTCWAQPGLSFEDGVDHYVSLLRVGREGAKAGDPNVVVAGLDVSGVDFDQGLRYTDAVLAKGANLLDLFTGHPYASPRYFGPGQHPKWPIQNEMAQKCTAALDALQQHGLARRMWIGELGWGLLATGDPVGQDSLDFAACVAQALIVGKSVPGVEKFLWFTMAGCNEGGYEYGLFRGAPLYPLPAAMAYATAAYVLDAARPVGSAQVTGDVHRASFACKERDELVVVWWSTGEPATLRPPKGAPAGRWVDGFSQDVRPARDGVKVGRLPVYWVLPLRKTGERPAFLDRTEVLAAEPVSVERVFVASLDHLGLLLRNKTNAPRRVQIEVRGSRRSVTLPANADAGRYEVPLPTPLAVGLPEQLSVSVGLGKARETRELKVEIEALGPPPAAFRADANLGEWAASPACELSSRADVLPPDPGIGWDGPADLSVQAHLAADARALYFAAAVTDDVHAAPAVGPDDFWNSDSIQLAIDPLDDSAESFDDDDREVGFVLAPDGPQAFLTYPAPPRRIDVPLAIRRVGAQTIYEASLPWKAIGVEPVRLGQVLAADFIANDNDGSGRRYWMGLTPGIGEGKSPASYRRFAIVGGGRPRTLP